MTQIPTYKQLRRSVTDRTLGGVCGGLATYFGVDPVAVRIGYALLTLISGGLLVLAYPILWLLMPEETAAQPWTAATQAAWAAGQPTPSDYPPAT